MNPIPSGQRQPGKRKKGKDLQAFPLVRHADGAAAQPHRAFLSIRRTGTNRAAG